MTSSVNVKQFLRQTYSELAKAEKVGDYERCLKACSKIIKFSPTDLLALQCKVVSLVQLQKFDEALTVLKKNANLTKLCLFEKAYCEYRLNKTSAAMSTLSSAASDDFRCQEVLAQLLYRDDKYEESYNLYLSLLKNSEDDYDEERKANMAATVSQMAYKSNTSPAKYSPVLNTYEQYYNEACHLCSIGQYEAAKEYLKTADKLCREVLIEEEVGDEEIEDETCCIKLMLAYCQQMTGKVEEAIKIYTDISKQKPLDTTLTAVAANNIVSLKKETNLFDARKKMKICQATNPSKLNHVQKNIACYNTLLVNLHSNQYEPSRKNIEELKNIYGAYDSALLCEAALLCRQKDATAAIHALEVYETEAGQSCPDSIFYTLLQIYLNENKNSLAINKLNTWPKLMENPAALSLFVALCLANDDRQAAADFLTSTLENVKKQKCDKSIVSSLLEECSLLYTNCNDFKKSAIYLEELRQMKPEDVNVLSRLINAYTKFDQKKAQELSRELPDFARLTADLDVDYLEKAEFLLMGFKYGAKKLAKVEATPKIDEPNLIAQKRKKKKRKVKLPKKIDPAVPIDVERWLPKFERSTYKKKKDKRMKDREIGRGTQGAVVTGGNEFDSSAKVGETAGSTPTSPKPGPTAPVAPGPRQQRPAAQKPKRKKKGGKW